MFANRIFLRNNTRNCFKIDQYSGVQNQISKNEFKKKIELFVLNKIEKTCFHK